MPPTPPPAKTPKERPALHLDVKHYQNLLDAPDLSPSEQRQLIEALWTLIVSFIDIGYDVVPRPDCGKPSNKRDDCACETKDMLNSASSIKSKEFAMAVQAQPDTRQTKEAS